MYSRYCRSMLFTPATAEHRYAKCHQSGADVCLADLEDSVPAHLKDEGRRRAAGFFIAAASLGIRCAVRINALTEPDGLNDLLALRGYRTPPDIVVVPKVESTRELEIVEAILGPNCPHLELLALIETPRALQRLDEIVTATPRLRGLVFGAADYAARVGCGMDWEQLAYARSQVVNAAASADLYAIDTPFFGLAEPSVLRQEARRASRLGFSGKVALHPGQVPVLNEAFSPDPDELTHAREVVSALDAGGVTTVNGSMVGPPFLAASKRLLEEFDPLQPVGASIGQS